jgi:hypothetical protein
MYNLGTNVQFSNGLFAVSGGSVKATFFISY